MYFIYNDDRQTTAVPDRKLSNKIYVPHKEHYIRHTRNRADKSFVSFFYFILSIYSLNWFFRVFLSHMIKYYIFDRYTRVNFLPRKIK